MEVDVADDAARCPVHWDDDARAETERKAEGKAASAHIDAQRAAAMAARVVEQRAADRGVDEIDSAFVERIGHKLGYGHPLGDRTGTLEFTWTPEAEQRLAEVPEFCRELTRWRVEWTAHKKNLGTVITPEIMETKYEMWGEASRAIEERHESEIGWTDEAMARLERVPEFVRGQVIQAIEGNARRQAKQVVDDDVIDDTIGRWVQSGDFHEGKFGFR